MAGVPLNECYQTLGTCSVGATSFTGRQELKSFSEAEPRAGTHYFKMGPTLNRSLKVFGVMLLYLVNTSASLAWWVGINGRKKQIVKTCRHRHCKTWVAGSTGETAKDADLAASAAASAAAVVTSASAAALAPSAALAFFSAAALLRSFSFSLCFAFFSACQYMLSVSTRNTRSSGAAQSIMPICS